MTSFKLEQDIPAAHTCNPAHDHPCFYLEAILDPSTPEDDLPELAATLLARTQSGECRRGATKLDRILDEALIQDDGSPKQMVLGNLFIGLAKQISSSRRRLDTLYRCASFCQPASFLDRLLAGTYLNEVQTLPASERQQELSQTARHAPRASSLHSESQRLLGQPTCPLTLRLGG